MLRSLQILFIYNNYRLVAQQINTTQKIEFEALENIPGTKNHVVIYDEDKNFLFSTPFFFANNRKNPEYGPADYEYKNFLSFDMINNKYFIILDMKTTINNKNFYVNIYSDITAEIADIYKLLKSLLLVNIIGIFYAFVLSFSSGKSILLPISR